MRLAEDIENVWHRHSDDATGLISISLPQLEQLTVLSKGNPTLQWQKVQLAQIDARLADKTIVGNCGLELKRSSSG